MTTYALARPYRLNLDCFAQRAGLHPDLVRHFVALGLLEPFKDAGGQLWFPPSALATVARLQRLRAGLPLNYAGIGLVLDLLERIEVLEDELRRGKGAAAPG
jgi:DNA-binding transcriptional MerR regulator